MKRVLSILLVVISLFTFCGCGSSKKSGKDNSTDTTKVEDKKEIIEVLNEEVKNISYDQYVNVKVGSKYKEVEKVLGEANKVKTVGDVKTYFWEGENDKGISLEVKDGVVISKSQSSLFEGNKEVTIDMYNQLKEGMSLDEVEGILGKGQLTMEEEEDGYLRTIYAYYNEDGSSIILNYRDGSLYSMSKNRLD